MCQPQVPLLRHATIPSYLVMLAAVLRTTPAKSMLEVGSLRMVLSGDCMTTEICRACLPLNRASAGTELE
eukprot:jgi/Chlat1/6044/Chrsp4S06209